MVRYPKNIVLPIPQVDVPAKESSPDLPAPISDAITSETSKPLSVQTAKPIHKYLVPSILGWAMTILMVAVLWKWTSDFQHPPFTAVGTLAVAAVDIKYKDISTALSGKDYVSIIDDPNFLKNAYQQNTHIPQLIAGLPLVQNAGIALLRQRISLVKDQRPGIIQMRLSGEDGVKAGNQLKAMVSVFASAYAHKRKDSFLRTINAIDYRINDLKLEISYKYTQLGSYEDEIRPWVIDAYLKENLDKAIPPKAKAIMDDFIAVKSELDALPQELMMNMSSAWDQVLLMVLSSRLTDLEFKKFFVPEELLKDFEGGIRLVKSQIATVVNPYYAQDIKAQEKAGIFLKGIYLKARYEALRVLVHKRYREQNVLSGRSAQYAAFKLEADQAYKELENLMVAKEQIKKFMTQDLRKEVKIQGPVTIIRNTYK